MMKLRIMQEIVETLDTDEGSPVAEEVLSCWQHDPGTARFFRASANFIFTFKNQAREYILRFNHQSERTPEGIRAELDYLGSLASQGICVALPVKSLSGKDLETVRTSSGEFHAVVFERLPGTQYEIDDLPSYLFSPGDGHWASCTARRAGIEVRPAVVERRPVPGGRVHLPRG